MKKILVVLTGGTIGSKVTQDCMDVTDSSPYLLLKLYRQRYGSPGGADDGNRYPNQTGETENEFEVINPLLVLSENMTLDTWTRLCRTMWEIPYETYEGVIVTHGSDTLSFTSALLGMLLRHVPVPVVLTASNYPLGEEKSNGLVNFRSAVELIRNSSLKGVFTVYQSPEGENNVYLASRLMEADPYRDRFAGFDGVPLGKMENGVFRYEPCEINPSLEEICGERQPIAGQSPVFRKPVLLLRPYPGLDYEMIRLDKKPAAVLHYLYHSSTACIAGEESSLLRFMERCGEENVPVYIASCKDPAGRNYATAKAILEKGAIPMENISLEASYAKLLLLYNLDEKTAAERVGSTFYFEQLPR